MKIIVKNYRSFTSNTLQGFADLELVDFELTFKGCTVHRKGDKAWIGLPQREYQNKAGERQWADIVQFSRAKGDEFRHDAFAAIDEYLKGQAGVQTRAGTPVAKSAQSVIPTVDSENMPF